MVTVQGSLQIKLLGTPSISFNGVPVEFPSRKSAALCLFLVANAGRRIERSHLAALLWGEHESEASRASLRKSLSLMRNDSTISDLIGTDRTHVWFSGDPSRSDLATFNRCLGAGTERAYREAARLWRGVPLDGLENGEVLFDEWINHFRNETTGLTHKLLAKRLDAMPEATTPHALQIAACELVVAVEPSDSEANERLIRILAKDGQKAAAARQFRAYVNALAELDLKPSPEIARLVRESSGQIVETPAAVADAPARGCVTQQHDRPHVALIKAKATSASSGTDLLSYAHSEVIHQLTRFRSMRCFERDDSDSPASGMITRIGFSDALDHDYRLLLWDEPRARSIYLRCLNARRQDTVSCVRIGYDCLDDRVAAETVIASAINSLEQDIVADDRPRVCCSPYERWLEAYKLLTQWNDLSIRHAMPILEELSADEQGQRLSLVHATISSVMMIRRLMVPMPDRIAAAEQERARESALKAIALDSLEPFNHVIYGWMRMQANEHDEALPSFDDAVALNPYSSTTMMSAAEANAYAGNADRAQALADRALALAGRYTPPYYHVFLANIAYMRGDLTGCVEALRRAPDNIHSAILLMAAQSERGDKKAIAAARVRFERELRRVEPATDVDGHMLSRWLVSTNMHRHPNVRHRLFHALEQAGLPLDRTG